MASTSQRPTRKGPGKAVQLSAPLLFAAVVAVAINLRAGISSVGPVLEETLAAFGAGASQAGLITAMPGFLFALMGLGAVPVAMRLGLTRTIALGTVLTFLGLAVRPWVGAMAVFIVLTGFVVAGIAVANVLLPAWIKQHGGRHMVALMTAYGALLGLSGAVGPLSALVFTGDGAWQWALAVWAVPAVVQVVVWLVVVGKLGNDAPRIDEATAENDAPLNVSMWRSPTALFLLLFFGLQSMNAYVQMGWLPQIYRDNGLSAATGTIALALVGGLNVVGGLVMPMLIARARTLTPFVVIFATATAAGYLGLLLSGDQLPLLWAFLLGLGGFCFPTAIALIPARSRSHVVTAKLSGFVQPYGYLLAGTGPVVVGVAYGATGQWREILIALVASAVLMGAIGIRAAAPVSIDDELAAAR
ncbi:MFS transporter [Corynebacterium tuscaniense]|uniref:MFS transporter n=1 Tax=Corynebacterium tuscaniense TaxID=302449 RepID=UPI00123C2B6A|nr:MFS transporter [Corynebacterium tuscaniense]KAA8742658.1 MFS transporter [Corynebacterium tuscaniense]